MIEPTVLRGFSDEYGSWKIICTSRCSALRRSPLRLRDVLALEQDLPEVGSSSRTSSRAVVLLPQPVSPTIPSVSPAWTANEMSSTAFTAPTWLLEEDPAA